jgi:hypothetical protein
MNNWVYHTTVRPRRKRLEGEAGNKEYQDEFMKAYGIFYNVCTNFHDIDTLKNLINESPQSVYRVQINTEGDNDEIDPTSTYHVKFTKSRFLGNPKFKRALIDYYNPNGLYIKGPNEIKFKKEYEEDNNDDIIRGWSIEFMLKKFN